MKYLYKVLYATILSLSTYLSYSFAPGSMVWDQMSLQQLLAAVFCVAFVSTFLGQSAGKWRPIFGTACVLLIGFFVAVMIGFLSLDNIHSDSLFPLTAIGNSVLFFGLGLPYVLMKLVAAVMFAQPQLYLFKKATLD